MSECVFCRIVARQIPATVVHEDEHTLAFMDLGQVNPGHVLVAVKEHAENLYALDDAQAGAVLRAAARVARAIRDAFAPAGLSVYQANGKAAGQTVFHLHVHILPRRAGVELRAHSGKMADPAVLAKHAEMIRAAIDT